MNVTHGRGYVYAIQYHIVWCVKYRRKILTKEVESKLINILKKIAEDNQIIIQELNTDLDHIRMLIACKPQHCISNFIKAFKGVSARLLAKEIPELKKQFPKGHLWNPSYYVGTVSENTEQQIIDYIKSQKER
jgi:transposase-like protein A